ncbi:arad-like aldolase/epimerase [Ascobolus immersus RN42]|uniref:Arad-like aldolase/epimerase n=1 Tax=Ascobolus immersus RN42 TaxID=1160509 RepID=A0A3N4HJJ5_ASCIM|nr:arad-like aldolase/epimerase [Ascobolus immersus RN42]
MCGDNASCQHEDNVIPPFKEPVTDEHTVTDNALVTSDDPMHPANIIVELCRLFYTLGWVTGTGGGISMREGQHLPRPLRRPKRAPPPLPNLHPLLQIPNLHPHPPTPPPPPPPRPSACTPLFLQAYLRRRAGACIHTHSMHAVLATLLNGGTQKVWKIRAAEMIKAIPRGGPGVGEVGTEEGKAGRGYFGCFEELCVPIIENRSREEDLREELERAMREYPECCAVLVRRHGVYVWGETVWKAKTQCESLDYLFQLSVEMTRMGLDPNADVKEIVY